MRIGRIAVNGYLLLIIAVFVAVAGYRIWVGRRREQALQAWAASRRWRPALMVDADALARHFTGLSLLTEGLVLTACWLTGRWQGREAHVIDIERRRKAGERPGVTGPFTCVVVKADLPLIPLRIRPEHAFDRLAAAFGVNDIDFESAAFSGAFHVSSPDRKWAYGVLHPRQQEILLERPRWWLELGDWWCLIATPGRLDAAELDHALDLAAGFVDRIPDHVRQEMLGPALAAARRRGP
jgi:hypothetical protein